MKSVRIGHSDMAEQGDNAYIRDLTNTINQTRKLLESMIKNFHTPDSVKVRQPVLVTAAGSLVAGVLFAVTAVGAGETAGEVSQSLAQEQNLHHQMSRVYPDIDASPLPPARGDFVSQGYRGDWHRAHSKVIFVRAGTSPTIDLMPRNCSPESIVHYAERAPENFEASRNGTLYGVRTHTPATRVGTTEGYNACALVVHSILKQAGCKWARYTASAKAIYDQAWKQGWRPSQVQKAGCVVAWNSRTVGNRPRIGRGIHRNKTKKKGVLYRHVGITVGNWMSMDNTSYSGRPSAGITIRPIRYEPPIFLCPPEKSRAAKRSKKSRK